MVSKKRLSYGFVGYQLPVIPKAPRSVRKRRPSKKLDDDQICAFELLAAVAGKLLQESESSASSNAGAPEGKEELANIKHVHVEDDKAVKSECLDQGSCVESSYIPEAVSQEHTFKTDSSKSILEHTIGNIQTQVEGGSPNRDDPQKGLDDDRKKTELTVGNKYGLKGQIQEDVNNSALINSDSSVQSLPLYRDTTPVPCASFVKSRNNVKLGIRDDDENYFGCYRYNSTRLRTFRSTPRIAYRRIRKMVTSGHWKVAPKLKDCERSYCNDGMKSFYRNRKSMRGSERRGLEVPSKRRKICEHRVSMTYDQEVSSESISNSPEKGIKGNTITSNQERKDPNVKFSIKSFKVPELYIEVPETETIGSLKKTVMEAVTAILGSGLRVGMVLQGKKVRDDYRTLQQAGIIQSSNLDSLGFTLEPSFTKVPPSLSPKDDSLASASYITDEELARRPPSPVVKMGVATALSDPPSETKLEKHDESNHEQGMSLKNTNPVDQSADEAISDSKALAVGPPANVEALASVPLNNKNKRSELSQRRTRRPFSVGEVEALVEAVEHLGTGRWRDVKMRAFEDADHRTYVDLKDKWKTLVHTASIAPQQRRGEPVPQDLLDRVLAAHGYWTQHQAKLHGKQHAEPLIVKM